jgi:hypothetical protein
MVVARVFFIYCHMKGCENTVSQKNDTMSHPPCSVLARKFNVAHINRHRLSCDSPILILICETILVNNDMRIIEIRQKLIEQEPIFGFEL